MLRHLPANVEAIRSSIEDLNLPRRWPVVLLASHLINHPDSATREAFLRCARRHLADGGSFFAQRHSATWLGSVEPGFIGSVAGVDQHVEQVSRADGAVGMTLRYEAFGSIWRQSFSAVPLSEEQVEAILLRCGFRSVAWHGPRRLWAEARAGEAQPLAPSGSPR